MRQLRVWLDDPQIGCGSHIMLEISQGRRYAHLLHVNTLTKISLPLDELARQERAGIAREVPISRGLIGRIERARRAAEKYGHRYSAEFVGEALEAVREDRSAA